jgi:hypothetical protein
MVHGLDDEVYAQVHSSILAAQDYVFEVDLLRVLLRDKLMHKLVGNSDITPREHPGGAGVLHCCYWHWFGSVSDRRFHPHVTCNRIMTRQHRTLMRFRLGCTENMVNANRHQGEARVPRADRHCPCCQAGVMEDELHMVLECPLYQDIRIEYPHLLNDAVSPDEQMARLFSDHDHQVDVANFIAAIVSRRKRHMS